MAPLDTAAHRPSYAALLSESNLIGGGGKRTFKAIVWEPDLCAREPRLSFAALSLSPIAAATCVGLSQMSRGQPC
jgi:hypothetical protein